MHAVNEQMLACDKGASIISIRFLNPNNVRILVGGWVMEHRLFGFQVGKNGTP